jgi:hypothetical protein
MPATETMENEEKLCLDCGKPLGPGKLGKKYCDEYCKSNYHNRVNREKKQTTLVPAPEPVAPKRTYPEHLDRINAIIINNRSILKDICDDETQAIRIRLRNLIGRGFNTKFFTSQSEPTAQGKVYNFCYEYGYREEGDGMVVVIYRPREIFF